MNEVLDLMGPIFMPIEIEPKDKNYFINNSIFNGGFVFKTEDEALKHVSHELETYPESMWIIFKSYKVVKLNIPKPSILEIAIN